MCSNFANLLPSCYLSASDQSFDCFCFWGSLLLSSEAGRYRICKHTPSSEHFKFKSRASRWCKPPFCMTYFWHLIKVSQVQLKEGRVYFGSWLRVQPVPSGKVWRQECVRCLVTLCLLSGDKGRNCGVLLHFSLYFLIIIPEPRPCDGDDCTQSSDLSSVFWGHLHHHTQKCVFTVTISPVKRTMKIISAHSSI